MIYLLLPFILGAMIYLLLIPFILGAIILNRFRGTEGYMAKVYGVVLGLVVYTFTGNYIVATWITVLFVLGESFGWGEWVGTLSVRRQDVKTENMAYVQGTNVGIKWLASKILGITSIEDFDVKLWIRYCTVALALRGILWWLCLIPLYFVGVGIIPLTISILVLGLLFPVACLLGYHSSKYFSLHLVELSGWAEKFWRQKYLINISGGWEHQEMWYGAFQGLIIGLLLIS